MEMLTSWLDDEDGLLYSPKLDHHADRAWRLLGELSDADADDSEFDAHETSQFADATDLKAHLKGLIGAEDQEKLASWVHSDADTNPLLLRVVEDQATELVILTRDETTGAFQSKRSGPDFYGTISKFVSDSFELTHAEFTLVRELLTGGTLREIADRLGKSWETTRSQVKSLTNKLGVNSQADILRMLGQAATLLPRSPATVAPDADATEGRVQRPDGRTVIYAVDGPPSDKTLVYLHGMIQGRHWPEKARALALSRGWRVVRISRAGRGPSTVNTKEGLALLQDHVDDVMAVLEQENIGTFSIYGTADGFSVGYLLALQHPERVRMIIGVEIIPPILSRKVVDGFTTKMKTFGLACLYAPKTIKFMLQLAMYRLERLEDRYNTVHPLLGVELAKYEDADGLRTDDLNFQDLMQHKSEGMWRDATFAGLDWAYAQENSNLRPRAALIHCGNSFNKSPGQFDIFAQRIGAPIHTIASYLPYVSSNLPIVLDLAEQSHAPLSN